MSSSRTRSVSGTPEACSITPDALPRPHVAGVVPEQRAAPLVGAVRPVSMLIAVDLPAPFGPSTARSSPERTSRSSPLTARTVAGPLPYCLEAPSSSARTGLSWLVGGGGVSAAWSSCPKARAWCFRSSARNHHLGMTDVMRWWWWWWTCGRAGSSRSNGLVEHAGLACEPLAATRAYGRHARRGGTLYPCLCVVGRSGPCASLRSRRPALLQSGTGSEALAHGTTPLQNRATDLVDKDTIRSEARQVESYVDGHAVG